MTGQGAALLPSLTASERAPRPRTLVDIFRSTADRYPDALAVDSGTETLTYEELEEATTELAARLSSAGIGPGDTVGVRIKSGTVDLYVAILGILVCGAAYVPVDADDPDERARVVFDESSAAAVVGNGLAVEPRGAARQPRRPPEVRPADDAWVIFTSGSTGTPKGVAVTHRNAAAFVDAEALLFLQHEPIGPGDRVMAASRWPSTRAVRRCGWRGGTAPASCRRPGRWSAQASTWGPGWSPTTSPSSPPCRPWSRCGPTPPSTRSACSSWAERRARPELASRLQRPGREVWNTYGPTEATVVACGALLDGHGPVRIGLPLDGWDLAVVDAGGVPVGPGETGELIIGGVGLARYLDPVKDAEAYAPMPALGWERAYRSGDVVRNDPEGLVFAGRSDDQVKLGGRRIELGEVDDQLLRLCRASSPPRRRCARRRRATSCWSATSPPTSLRPGHGPGAASPSASGRAGAPAGGRRRAAHADLRQGRPGRPALAAGARAPGSPATCPRARRGSPQIWYDVLGAEVTAPTDDFFDFGGGSLTAAQVVGRLRERFPEVAVGDLYANPTIAALSATLDELGGSVVRTDHRSSPSPGRPRRASSPRSSPCELSLPCAGWRG